MNNISLFKMISEENTELIYGFIQFAFSEMQTEGWTIRRSEMIEQFNTNPYGRYADNRLKPTFGMMEQRVSLDDALYDFFVKEIEHEGWIDAYVIRENPDFHERTEDGIIKIWIFEKLLTDWLYEDHMIGEKYVSLAEMLKDILAMDFCLK